MQTPAAFLHPRTQPSACGRLQTPSGNFDSSSRKLVPSTINTQSTTLQSTGGKKSKEDFILAVTENKHREIGISLLSVRGATMILSQFKDDCTYSTLLHCIETYTPTEILLPHTMESSGKTDANATMDSSYSSKGITGTTIKD
eukprot:753947-Hanusia_phi.AAC.1